MKQTKRDLEIEQIVNDIMNDVEKYKDLVRECVKDSIKEWPQDAIKAWFTPE